MNSIISHIEYLLHIHDCVIVPGWGTFIAQTSRAYVSDVDGVIMPPVRTISFNSAVNHDDAMLCSSIARKEGVPYSVAFKSMSTEVDGLKSSLTRCGEVSFGSIGEFRYENDSMVFYPRANYFQYNMAQFGLPKLNMAKLNSAVAEEGDVAISRGKQIMLRIANYAASIAVLIALFCCLSTPTPINFSDSEFASLALFKHQAKLIEQVETKTGELRITLPPADSMSIYESEEESEAESTVDAIPETNVTLPSADGDYYLVVASLYTSADAERYLSDSRHKDLKYIEMNGKYRVYVASSDNFSELSSIRDSRYIADNFPGAWICKK